MSVKRSDDLGVTVSIEGDHTSRLTVNFPAVIAGVSKLLIKGVTGNVSSAAEELPEIATALGLQDTPSQRATNLIVRSLERSLSYLVSEVAKEDVELVSRISAASFVRLSDNVEIDIGREFFDNPTSSSAMRMLLPEVRRWLETVEIQAHIVNNVAARFPALFARSLHDEWRSDSSYYAIIKDASDSPFASAATLERDWTRYRAFLIAQCAERVFEESFSLRQIYVPLRCYYTAPPSSKTRGSDFANGRLHSPDGMRHIRWVHEEISEWTDKDDRYSTIQTISGGPGSGKSSFAKIMSSELADKNRLVLFVPLHLIDIEAGIARSIADYFIQSGHFATDPLQHDSHKPLIIILDGLDEIQMQGKAAQESAQSFVDDVIRYADRRNTTGCKVLVLITGRDIAVQSAENALKREGRVLHLSPYFIPSEEHHQYDQSSSLIEIDQRDEWWIKYGSLTGSPYGQMPSNLRNGELSEVTSQPLLNYLVALSYRRGMKLSEDTNINSVYADLLLAVHERGWARHAHPTVKDVRFEDFVRLLEEVALSVWHGAGRTATLTEVENHCQQSKVGSLLPGFQSGVSSGVSSLLLAFYFRQKGRREGGEKTFEFTHKTFSEYLIALRVVRLAKLVTNLVTSHNDDPDQGIDDQEALFKWLVVCGKTSLDQYLLDFIRRQFTSVGTETTVRMQNILSGMMGSALSVGWPINRIDKLSFNEQQSHIRNAEETLLACLNCCAAALGVVSSVKWPAENSAGEMIKRLQGQRKGPTNRPFMSCLSYMNFDGQYFDICDLYNADLRSSTFRLAKLNYAILMQADVQGCDFSDAAMQGANLSGANLEQATISMNQLFGSRGDRMIGLGLDERDESNNYRRTRANVDRQLAKVRRRGINVVGSDGSSLDDAEIRTNILPEGVEDAGPISRMNPSAIRKVQVRDIAERKSPRRTPKN